MAGSLLFLGQVVDVAHAVGVKFPLNQKGPGSPAEVPSVIL
jgi:hypothetical protein